MINSLPLWAWLWWGEMITLWIEFTAFVAFESDETQVLETTLASFVKTLLRPEMKR